MSSHPVAITAIVLAQTLVICLLSWSMVKISWFSYILFLIFLGGLIVLFIYITRLASNEKFEINTKEIVYLFLSLSGWITFFLLLVFFNIEIPIESLILRNSLKIIFSLNNIIISSTVIIYLLLTLLVAVYIASIFEGPLRNLTKKN